MRTKNDKHLNTDYISRWKLKIRLQRSTQQGLVTPVRNLGVFVGFT